jgi:hypothetical protein
VVGYSDADFASCEASRKSVLGYIFLLCNGPVSWRSRQDTLTALSTMDAEFSALSQATREATWFRALLGELGYEQLAPTPVNCDNRAAIELSKDNKHHNRAKHIDIRHHHVRDMVRTGATVVPYVRTGENLADQFTKALPRDQHGTLISAYGLVA